MLSKLKEKVEIRLKSMTIILFRLGVTSNALTVAGLCFSIAAGCFYILARVYWYYWIAATFLSLSGLCDVLDGAVARFSGTCTPFGSFLDSLLDRYSDAIIILSITISNAQGFIFNVNNIVWGMLAIIGSITVSYARAKAESLNIPMASIGLAERPERIMILLFFTVILRPELGVFVVAILSNVTVIQRGLYVHRKLKSKT